jgi:hypothetical protein
MPSLHFRSLRRRFAFCHPREEWTGSHEMTSHGESVTQASSSLRGGLSFRVFDVAFANGTRVRVTASITKDGKYEQFLVEPAV